MIGRIQYCGIATDGLFLNEDAGFDAEDFRIYFYQQEIVDNIDKNRRNGDMEEHLFDELLYKCRFVEERINVPGWMLFRQSLYVLIQMLYIGKPLI